MLEPPPAPVRRRVLIAGDPGGETNVLLVEAWRRLGIDVSIVAPLAVRGRLRSGDVLLGRLDVLPTLDGVVPGLLELLLLERGGATVLNRAFSLLAAHDKRLTARLLERAGVPHPRTEHLPPGGTPTLEPPLVVKPRFGSWGADVVRCESAAELERCLAGVVHRPWFRRHGAVLQELIPPVGYDLRLLVARDRIVGAVERVAVSGDWRTNISLGGSRRPVTPDERAQRLGIAAAAAIGANLVGVDLLPLAGGYTVIELNGAVDFDPEYALRGGDLYAGIAEALGLRGDGSPLLPTTAGHAA